MALSPAEAVLDLPAEAVAALGIALLVVTLAAGSWLSSAWHHARRSARSKARARRAVDGENRSELLLARAGYTLLARQPRLAFLLLLDGDARTVDLRADWLVERGGRRYVADTKTGARAPSLDHAPTRRQLLEYRVAYDVEGVLLIDAETDTIHEVQFPALAPRGGSRARAFATAIALLLLGALGALAAVACLR